MSSNDELATTDDQREDPLENGQRRDAGDIVVFKVDLVIGNDASPPMAIAYSTNGWPASLRLTIASCSRSTTTRRRRRPDCVPRPGVDLRAPNRARLHDVAKASAIDRGRAGAWCRATW